MNKRWLNNLFMIALLMAPLLTWGQTSKKSKGGSKSEQLEKSLLWEITGNDLKAPSYLFGTIHVICADDYFWPDYFNEALQQTEQLCLEMDIASTETRMKLANLMLNMDGNKLSEKFDEQEWAQFQEFVKKSAPIVPAVALDMMKPQAILMMMSMSQITCSDVQSYEMELMEKAGERGMKVVGLETVEQQAKVILSIPEEQAIDMIKASMRSSSSGVAAKQFADMMNLYKSQDISALHEISTKDSLVKLDGKAFLSDRNEDWIDKMKQMMSEKRTFFAVGAAHLAGEDGVINLLRKAGYTLKPVLR